MLMSGMLQPPGWTEFQTMLPPLPEAAIRVGASTNAECRRSCAADGECYCYAFVEGVCYSGLSRCECEAGSNASCSFDAMDDGFIAHKDVVRRALCSGTGLGMCSVSMRMGCGCCLVLLGKGRA